MRLSTIIRISIAASLLTVVAAAAGCGSYGGADVYLENISIGNVSVDGKPVSGLPTQKVSIVLKTDATKILVSQSGGKTIIKLEPSGAVITSGSDGLSFTGVKSEQVEMKWGSENTTK
jgi:hypothetical protein